MGFVDGHPLREAGCGPVGFDFAGQALRVGGLAGGAEVGQVDDDGGGADPKEARDVGGVGEAALVPSAMTARTGAGTRRAGVPAPVPPSAGELAGAFAPAYSQIARTAIMPKPRAAASHFSAWYLGLSNSVLMMSSVAM